MADSRPTQKAILGNRKRQSLFPNYAYTRESAECTRRSAGNRTEPKSGGVTPIRYCKSNCRYSARVAFAPVPIRPFPIVLSSAGRASE